MTQAEEHEALVKLCAEEAAKVWTSENKKADIVQAGILFQPTVRAVLAVIAEKAKEWPTEEMDRAFWRSCDDLRNMDVHKDWRFMWRASPLVNPDAEKAPFGMKPSGA